MPSVTKARLKKFAVHGVRGIILRTPLGLTGTKIANEQSAAATPPPPAARHVARAAAHA